MFPDLKGAFTALDTPFDSDGNIDWELLERLIEFQICEGIRGLVPAGTTGESPTLSPAEHDKLIEFVVSKVRRRRLVIAGTGSNSTREALTRTKHALMAGADGVLVVDCYYNRPPSAQLRERYYRPIAELASELNPDAPVIPYIIPARTGTKLEPIDLAWLAENFGNIRAVKEATGSRENMRLTRKLLGPGFTILSGDDDLTCEVMMDPAIRASGVISVMANVFPGAISSMVKHVLAGTTFEASKIHDSLKPLFECIGITLKRTGKHGEIPYEITDRYPNPIPVKTLMAALSMVKPDRLLREPLGNMPLEGVTRLREVLRAVWQEAPGLFRMLQSFYSIKLDGLLGDDALWSRLVEGAPTLVESAPASAETSAV